MRPISHHIIANLIFKASNYLKPYSKTNNLDARILLSYSIKKSENFVITNPNYKIKNIDLRLKNDQTYLLWVEVLKEPFHALYTYYDPYFKKDKNCLIHEKKKFKFCREVKLCDNKWFLRNVNKIWEVKFYAKAIKTSID